MLERLNISNARILASAATSRSPLVISFRFDRDAEPLDSGRVAAFVEFYAGDTDA
jgi:hypothetical protein